MRIAYFYGVANPEDCSIDWLTEQMGRHGCPSNGISRHALQNFSLCQLHYWYYSVYRFELPFIFRAIITTIPPLNKTELQWLILELATSCLKWEIVAQKQSIPLLIARGCNIVFPRNKIMSFVSGSGSCFLVEVQLIKSVARKQNHITQRDTIVKLKKKKKNTGWKPSYASHQRSEVNKYAILIFHRRLWFPSVRWHRQRRWLTIWIGCTKHAEQARGEGSTHLLNQPGPRRGGGAKPITWDSSVNTLMWILKLKVFMNETPLFKTRPPPSQRRTTWRKKWGKAEWLKGFSKLVWCSVTDIHKTECPN